MARTKRSRPGPAPSAAQRTKGRGKADLIVQLPQEKATQKRRNTSQKSKSTKISVEHLSTPSDLPPTPKNPHATLLGIPTELRLEIYSYVFDSTLIHVHHHTEDELDDQMRAPPRFTWTPCRGVNPNCNLLCASPKWSGLCKESERCTFRPFAPSDPTGFAALTWSCKLIRQETQEFFLRNTTVSIHPKDVRPWLDHLESHAPTYINLLRRITIAGPDCYKLNIDYALGQIRDRVPNLEGVGFQGQVQKWLWNDRTKRTRIDPHSKWKQWQMTNWMKKFDREITVAMEGLVWAKPRRYWSNGPSKDEQSVFRIVRAGKVSVDGMASGTAWEDTDVDIDMEGPDLVEPKRTAKWRKWWRTKDVKHFM